MCGRLCTRTFLNEACGSSEKRSTCQALSRPTCRRGCRPCCRPFVFTSQLPEVTLNPACDIADIAHRSPIRNVFTTFAPTPEMSPADVRLAERGKEEAAATTNQAREKRRYQVRHGASTTKRDETSVARDSSKDHVTLQGHSLRLTQSIGRRKLDSQSEGRVCILAAASDLMSVSMAWSVSLIDLCFSCVPLG